MSGCEQSYVTAKAQQESGVGARSTHHDQGKLRAESGKSQTTGQDHSVVKSLLKISSKVLRQNSGGRKKQQDEEASHLACASVEAQLLLNGFVR